MTETPTNLSTATVTGYPLDDTLTVGANLLGWDEEICPGCHTPRNVGFYRGDYPVGHPKFGKLVKCSNNFHAQVREARISQISTLGPEDIKIRIADIKLNQYNRPMIAGCKKSIERGYGWLYLHGGKGNAKTVALKAIVNEMNIAGRGPALFTTFYQVLMYVKAAFDKDAKETELERFNRLVSMPIVAIDEVGQVKETEWLDKFRFNFLNARYEMAINKAGLTVFASNASPKQIFTSENDPFGALLDRIEDNRFMVIENQQPSTRRGEDWVK